MKKHIIVLSLYLILAITFFSFYPSLKYGFVNRDDNFYVTENPLIKELSWENIKTIFSHPFMGHYHPLTLLSNSLEYHFFKLNPLVYHLTNLILHLMNGLLVFLMTFMLKGGVLTSLVVSLLFGVHPLHVESVVWISARKDVLYTFFFLGSLILYLHYQKTQSVRTYLLSFILFILSLLSKSMAVTLPVVLLLCDYLLHRKFDRKCLIEKIPFLITALIFGISAFLAQGTGRTIGPKPSFSFINMIFVMSEALVFYVSKLILPIKLSCLYPFIRGDSPWRYVYMLFILGFLIGGVLLIIWGKNRKTIFGLLFFLVTLLPILPLKIVADRFTYVPFLGIFFIFGEGFSWLYSRSQRDSRLMRTLFSIVLIGIIGVFSFLTWEGSQVWKDSIALWGNVIKKYPNLPKAYASRGEAYSEIGQYDQAIKDYTQALEINPKYAEAYYDRGNTYVKRGLLDQAISDYTKALEIDPRHAKAYYNRGNAYAKRELLDQAISDYTKALEANTQYVEAYTNRGSIYLTRGEYEKAISDFKKAIGINSRYAIAYYNQALAYEKIGRIWDAIQAYRGFIKNARPHYADHIPYAQERIRELSGGKTLF